MFSGSRPGAIRWIDDNKAEIEATARRAEKVLLAVHYRALRSELAAKPRQLLLPYPLSRPR